MTAIWRNDGSGWRLLAPTGFPDEAALHSLVEQAPQLLPLAGAHGLVVVGREVQLGTGYADLIAVEPTGRLVIIEVKLARNAEARRAVVTQALTYAAYLRGLDPSVLDEDILGRHLRARNYENLAGAISANDQEGSFDASAFTEGLAESIAQGRFRIVFVLDDVPEELVRLVGFLEAVTDKILIDLIRVSSYEINGSQILVPQRVDAASRVIETAPPITKPATEGRYVEGPGDFIAAIDQSLEQHRPVLRKMVEWARILEREGLVRLWTYHGKSGRLTLLPQLPAEGVGLVTIWNDNGPFMSLWRSVIQRRAPNCLPRIEQIVSPTAVGQGTTVRDISDELLEMLTAAYREANGGKVEPIPTAALDSDEPSQSRG